MKVMTKSVYEAPSPDDGVRVLMDRHWPRGLTKERAALDEWRRELAPSVDLGRRFRDDADFDSFTSDYAAELAGSEAARDLIEAWRGTPALTICYAAKDRVRNHATVLGDVLRRLVDIG